MYQNRSIIGGTVQLYCRTKTILFYNKIRIVGSPMDSPSSGLQPLELPLRPRERNHRLSANKSLGLSIYQIPIHSSTRRKTITLRFIEELFAPNVSSEFSRRHQDQDSHSILTGLTQSQIGANLLPFFYIRPAGINIKVIIRFEAKTGGLI